MPFRARIYLRLPPAETGYRYIGEIDLDRRTVPWSYRTLSAKEYEAEYGRPYDGRFVLVIAIENQADADKLYAHFAEPAGSA